ncbi:MAG: molybdopterin cofactor-binding domain-containing protein, partial [Parahaliea sp.]
TLNEELQGDWDKVRTEYADTRRDLLENDVYSSVGGRIAYFSGRSTGDDRTQTALLVGATARECLKTAAAQGWGVPVAEVRADNSQLTHEPSGRSLGYGEVAEAAARVRLAAEPKLKPRSEWRTLTHISRAKLQDPMLVNGSAVYGIDVQLPDKVYAALRQSPVHGGRLVKVDKQAVMKMPGVLAVVVVDPDEARKPLPVNPPFPIGGSAPQAAVAVIAEHYWQARTALDALPLEWDPGDGARWRSNAQIRETVMQAVREPGEITIAEGDAPARIAAAEKPVVAEYFTGYADHVTMEPLNGTALVTDKRLDLWIPSQHTQQAHLVAASESGLAPDQVYVHQTFVGGGFGRRAFGDETRMVVAVARQFPGRPVHTIWSREESMRQGRFRAMIGARLQAGLDSKGYPTGLLVRHAGRGQGVRVLNDTAYLAGKAIPALQVEQTILPLHIMTGPYRGPSYNVNTFIMESFIDELAAAAGIDPLTYRLQLLEPWADKGWARLLRIVAERAGWGQTLPRGQGMGLAIANWGSEGRPHHGSTAAAVVRVECSREGELKILQIDAGCDVGTIANPDAVRAQIQGGTIFGLNMSLMEEL